jgi:hypothetical protein
MGWYCECADKEGGVGCFFGFDACEMIDLAGLVIGVGHEFFEFSHVLPGFGEVEGSEVLIEAVVDEVLSCLGGTLSMLK